jgi:hypothetical protein
MALNKYTTSSRFSNTTTPPPVNGNVIDLPEVNVKGNGETAAQRNEKKYREYQAKKQQREKLVSAEKKRVSSSQKDIANYDKFVKDFNKANPGMDFENQQKQKMDFSMFAGGAKKVGADALKRYNEMERSEGRPAASTLYRPGDFKDDDAFLKALTPKGTSRGAIHHSTYKRPSKYNPKTYPEIGFPDIEENLDRMEIIPGDFKTRKQRVRNIELSDQSGPEYSDPSKPGRGKKDVFRGQKVKYAKKASRNNKKGSKGLGYKTEERLAKATYGRGLEGTNLEGLSERKGEAKYERRRALATGNISAAMDAGREVRDVRKAERYRKAAMGEGGARMSGKIDRTGAIKYFTPESMQGFRDSKDNPLNRNRRS